MFLQRSGRVCVVILALLFIGCGDPPANPSTEVVIVPHVSEDVRGKLLEGHDHPRQFGKLRGDPGG